MSSPQNGISQLKSLPLPPLKRLHLLHPAGVDQRGDRRKPLQPRQVVGLRRRELWRLAFRDADERLALLLQPFGEPALLLAGDGFEVGLELAEREDAEIVEAERQVRKRCTGATLTAQGALSLS
jgi:hypothetical protein